jgi:hypothetical protein
MVDFVCGAFFSLRKIQHPTAYHVPSEQQQLNSNLKLHSTAAG